MLCTVFLIETHSISPPSSSHHWQLPEEQRYIQTSRVPTLHFQPSLPRLKIPVLADTCQRYLDAVRPVVSSDQFRTTEAIVREFGREGGVGEGELSDLAACGILMCSLFCTQNWTRASDNGMPRISTPATYQSRGTTCT